jgi:hypothetical protein
VARKNFAVLDAATGAVLAPTLQVQYIGGTSIAGNRVYVSGTCQASSLPAICAYDLDLIPLPGWTFPFANQFIGPIAAADSALFATHRSFDFPFVERTVKLDPATGAEVPWTAVVTTGGTDVLTVAAGRLYLGGRFTAVNGQARTRLAALDATTGALDAWAPLVGGPVAALSVQGGEVAFGGSFTSAGGIKKRNLVAIDLRTGQPTSPNAPDLPITATAYLKLGDVMVVAGGRLPAITPTEPDVMAFLTSTGALLPWSLTSDWQVAALATDGRRLYLGGRFSQISGVARRNVAAVDLQTAALDAWNPSSTDPVRTLAVSEGALYAGGGYPGSPGGGPDPHNMVAAWDLASGSVLPFSPRAAMLTTAGLAFHRQRVLLVGGPVDALEWVDRSSGAPVPPASAIGGIGYAAAQAGDTVFVTGSSAVGTGAVALVDAPSGRIQVWEPGGSPGAIAANTDYVALGGFFAGDSGGRIPGTLLVYRTPTSGAPQHVTATVENATVTLGWQPGTAPAATSFLVEVGTSSGAIDIGSFAVGPATSVSGTLPAGTYFTRIRGVGANGPGTASSEVIVTVPATSTPPNAPGTLSVSVASGVVTLQWGAASGNATTYVVEAGSASGLSTIGTFATGHLDTSVTTPAPSGTYFVRIRAANAFGTSTPSNEVTVVVP